MSKVHSSEDQGRLLISFFFVIAAMALFIAGITKTLPETSQVLGAQRQNINIYRDEIKSYLDTFANRKSANYTQEVIGENLSMQAEYFIDTKEEQAYSISTINDKQQGTIIQEDTVKNGLVKIKSNIGHSQFGGNFENSLIKLKESFMKVFADDVCNGAEKNDLQDGTIKYTFTRFDNAVLVYYQATIDSSGDISELEFPHESGGTQIIKFLSFDGNYEMPELDIPAPTFPE